MKIYVYPADMHGCGFYRLIWPAEALAAQGHDVTVVKPSERTTVLGQKIMGIRGVMKGDTLIDVKHPHDADVMVFQRVTHKYLSQATSILRKKGITVVIDMDDDLSTIHPNNPAWGQVHPKNEHVTQHSWTRAEQSCRDASLVTLSTPTLMKRYAPHGRYRVLPNYVPRSYLDVRHEDSRIIGWAGSTHSHPDDLPVVGPSVSRLVDSGATFYNAGSGNGVQAALGIRKDILTSGVVDLIEWPDAVARLGIGIAPLADTIFNASKSWLKPLEYAALGVPWVASPRVEYRRLHKMGMGLLAQRPKDWYRQLRRLVDDETLRLEMSAVGREIVREHLLVEENAWRWAEAWTDAYEMDRSGSTARPGGGSPAAATSVAT